MEEKALKKRVIKGILVCLCAGALVLIGGICLLGIMNRSLMGLVSQQMEDEAYEYKRRITRQLDKDFQTLYTLAAFFECGEVTDQDWFEQALYDSNATNDFITLSYFRADGMGVMTHNGLGVESYIDYRTLGKEVQSAIRKALQGESGLSEMFDSTVTKEKVFIYAVPVFEGDEVKGVVAASDHVELFYDIIEGDSILGGSGSVQLLSSEGKVLVSSMGERYSGVDAEILKETYFSKDEIRRIKNCMEQGKPAHSEVIYDREKFRAFFAPAGVNGWYIMCVNTKEGTNVEVYRIVRVMGLIFILLLALILCLLFYISRQIIRNNRALADSAYKDSLTGADNRLRFIQKLEVVRRPGRSYCIVVMNIRQFKFLNEIFGAKQADKVLCAIKEAIQSTLRPEEFFCRAGGDEFYILFRESEEKVIKKRLESIMDDAAGRALMGEKDYQLLLYAGAYIWHDDHDNKETAEILITRARFAMKHARTLLAEPIHFYDENIHKSEELENYVETHMHQALEKEEFRLYLQPKINLSDGTLGGAEALVRWITEDGTKIYPDSFIPLFEQNGFCVQLDMYMAEKVFRQIRSWMDEGIEPIPVSINQSKLLFFDAAYTDNMKLLLEKYRIPASLITLEILEGLALEHEGEINVKIRRLKKLGFRISMDDFGTGYSSFNTLGHLQIDELKLDRSFLLEATEANGEKFRQIMEHIVSLTKKLHIDTVAEGVETKENEDFLREIGCDFGQGYLYSPPISAEEFSEKYMG